jgi:hypothetical protein
MLRTIEKEEISLQSIIFDDIDPFINKKNRNRRSRSHCTKREIAVRFGEACLATLAQRNAMRAALSTFQDLEATPGWLRQSAIG